MCIEAVLLDLRVFGLVALARGAGMQNLALTSA